MQRLVTLMLAIALFWLVSFSPQVTAGNNASGDRVNPPVLNQNRDCKGDKKDDC